LPRKSAAALAFANPAPSFARVSPPAGADAAQLEVFQQITNSVDAGHFEASDVPLLMAYVDAILLQRRSAKELAEHPNNTDALAAFSVAVRLLVLLAAKLKLSPMSRRHNYRKSAKPLSAYDAMEEDA
jgi:hypothetical protein